MFRFLVADHPVLPLVYVMIGVVCLSSFPALYALGNAEESPFLFTGLRQISGGAALCAFALLIRGKFLRKEEVKRDILSYSKSRLMVISVIGQCGLVTFAAAIALVDVSIAAILYETWPFFLIPLMAFLFRNSNRYRANLVDTMFFITPAVVGVALVILSQNDTNQFLLAAGQIFRDSRTTFGVIFVVLSAISGAVFLAYTLKMGEVIADNHPDTEKGGMEEIVLAVVMTSICLVIAGGVSCVIGLISSETVSSHQLTYAIASGLFIDSLAILAFRIANLKTDNIGVNALSFSTPVVALIWLWALSLLKVPHLDYLIIGALGIVAANLLINVDASRRFAYKALVLSLWVFGTIAYFTDGYSTDVPLELPVTVFILVLAFRVDRLVRRTGQEEEWVFEAFHRIKTLEENEVTTSSKGVEALQAASGYLMDIDSYKDTDGLIDAYESTVECLERAAANEIPRGEIREIRRVVDSLAHSRQQGSRFGEFVAILITGALIVTGLMIFNGDRELYGDITSFLLSSVVVFLLFNIADLQRDRRDETLKVKGGRYIVNFEGVGDREKQQYVSMGTSVLIIAVFVALFFTKA